jgi:nucleoside-diphosphate-sugar epimerase
MRKVIVTGATGFTGSHVVQALLRFGFEVSCFVRNEDKAKALLPNNVELLFGDLKNKNSLVKALSGKKTLVNVASSGSGYTQDIVNACLETGVSRIVFFSSTALFTTLPAESKIIRSKAEKDVIESGLDFTIVRPTMIYGTPKDRNMIKLIKFLYKSPFMPIFGSGKALQQPVFVEDLADAIPKILESNVTKNKAYNLSGKYPLSFNDVVDITAAHLGKRVMKFHLPVWLSIYLAKCSCFLPGIPKITEEQILRLNEDKNFDHSEAIKDFGFTSRSFEEGIAAEIKVFMYQKRGKR